MRDIKDTDFKGKGPVARYMFDEGKEDVIHDSGSVSNPVNLFMPNYIRRKTEAFLSFSIGSLHNNSQFSDIIINILIFIPSGDSYSRDAKGSLRADTEDILGGLACRNLILAWC